MEKEKEKEKEQGRSLTVRVGISIGDLNGIGAEVVMKALSDNRLLLDCTPIIYANSKVLSFHKKSMEETEFNFQSCKTAEEAIPRKVNLVNCWNEEVELTLGEATEMGGKYAFISLERATEDLASGKIDVLVTAPISKLAMSKSGFQFPGHTEYLAHLAKTEDALMMMVADDLRVALVTTHIPLMEVSKNLSREKIVHKLKELNQSLVRDFGIQRPKIAVLGLNPHAGENGKMGTEEQELIIPAVNAAKNDSILAFGPFPADGFFGSSSRSNYDAVLAMYHDQGLTAFKALAFDEGVNFTAGLPIVRTSPDHGTAFDIAGKNMASPASTLKAIYLAMDVFRQRKFYKEMYANPLAVSPPDRRRNPERD